jgi:hypothetical protein
MKKKKKMKNQSIKEKILKYSIIFFKIALGIPLGFLSYWTIDIIQNIIAYPILNHQIFTWLLRINFVYYFGYFGPFIFLLAYIIYQKKRSNIGFIIGWLVGLYVFRLVALEYLCGAWSSSDCQP